MLGPIQRHFPFQKTLEVWFIGKCLGAPALGFFGCGVILPISKNTSEAVDRTSGAISEAVERAGFAVEKSIRNVGESVFLPKDGVYIGSTTESDGVSQETQMNLEFTFDGKILGNGNDSTDGKYEIVDGKWKKNGDVYWKEKYRRYNVSVDGYYIPRDDKISCIFRPTRGVTSLFDIRWEKHSEKPRSDESKEFRDEYTKRIAALERR